MAWPKHIEDITVCKFPRCLLPLMMHDIDNDVNVEWTEHDLFAESRVARFTWHGALFEMWENWEIVTTILHIRGKYDSPEITAALLKYKHDESR